MRAHVAAAVFLTTACVSHLADACGLVGSRSLQPFDYPYLTEERVLIVWNQQTKKEHFVREVRFEKANQTFGFVVPTPTKPEVQKVEKSPFPSLQDGLPFEVSWGFGHGGGTGIGMGYGSGGGKLGAGGSGPPPVEVLAVQRLGKFDAFTLAAHDAEAFRHWLEDNHFGTTPELEKWLGHYVELGFHFVALRYVAKPDEAAGMSSEVLRISFDSELPYYPYFEPRAPERQFVRRLTTWFVSQEKMSPVAGIARDGKLELVRPWHAGAEYHPTVKLLGAALGELQTVLPGEQGELQVQVFRDRKVSRTDFHDVIFAPTTPKAADETKLRPMLAWIDPALAESGASPVAVASAAPAPAPSVSAVPPAPASASAAKSAEPPSSTPKSSCAMGHAATSDGLLGLWGCAALVVLRRRRAVAAIASLLVSVGCAREKLSSAPDAAPLATTASVSASASVSVSTSASASAAPTVSASSAPSLSPEERKRREALLLAAFAGTVPSGLRLEAGPFADPPPVFVEKPRGVRIVEGKTEVTGKLPPAVVRRILRANFPRLRMCYEQGLKRDPGLKGTVALRFVINTKGEIESSAVAGGTLTDPAVASCANAVVRTLSFPQPEEGKVAVKFTPEFKMNE